MLYIQATNFSAGQIDNVIEKYSDYWSTDYYAGDRDLTNELPLAVLNMTSGEVTAVKNGYTITPELFVYSSCRSNMMGLFLGHDGKWYLFMAGRRHGVAVVAVNYFFPELVPELKDPVVYITQNSEVGPLETDVAPSTPNKGTVCTMAVEVDESNVFDVQTPTRLNPQFIRNLKAQAALWGDDLPVDLVDIELEALTVKVGAPEEWAPTVTVDGIRFKAESIESDCNGLSLKSGSWVLTIRPEAAGNRHTEMLLNRVSK